ncbi:hypothetical protein [Methylobacterium sp. WL19]|uniref:hypothetical protein n=1 Tax=Methylobacterium sp. WL19 TaxID=2603896 RepID=UPI0011C840E3|nr:hypothetical protein [Methylobacterium sp. WL19]TXN26873.1 hypothetical protein FV220_13620 [Methylobacterium sp. WL19]
MSITLAAEFGLREQDGKAWITLKAKETESVTFIWPGGIKRAGAVAQAINAIGKAEAAMKAARKDCRDPDTDSALSTKAGELLDEALMALGVKP